MGAMGAPRAAAARRAAAVPTVGLPGAAAARSRAIAAGMRPGMGGIERQGDRQEADEAEHRSLHDAHPFAQLPSGSFSSGLAKSMWIAFAASAEAKLPAGIAGSRCQSDSSTTWRKPPGSLK